MSAMTAMPPASPAVTRVRVAAREIHEAAFRALIAVGVSGGEATAAAQAVVEAEITDGSGIAALLAELARLPAGKVPVSLRRGVIDVLDDPAERGPLLLGPLAVDLAVAVDRPVLLPGVVVDTVLERFALAAARRAGVPLGLGTVTDDGITEWSVAMPDATIRRFPSGAEPPCDVAIKTQSGALFRQLTVAAIPTGATTVQTAAAFAERCEAAWATGLRVDAGQWAPTYHAARRFLVPDPPH